MVVLPITYPCVLVSYWMDKLSKEMNFVSMHAIIYIIFFLKYTVEPFLAHDISKLRLYRYNFYLSLLKWLIMCSFGFG